MFGKIEHIGFAVRDLGSAIPLYEQLTGAVCYKTEEVESERVITAFLRVGDTKLELLQATSEDSPVHRSIEKRGEGFHHMAYEVADIYEEMERVKGLGIRLLNDKPKDGADNKLICFLHPRDTAGVLVELCQEKK